MVIRGNIAAALIVRVTSKELQTRGETLGS